MNPRFSEYTTSGAFSLALTRNQVSSLAFLEGGAPGYSSHIMSALERKGLAEPVAMPSTDDPERIEFRPTHAGLLTAALCREAGLSNGPPDPVAVELAALKAEIEARRIEAADARRAARSAMARKEEAELELENLKRRAQQRRLMVRILTRDPTPDRTDAQLMADIQEPTR